MSLADADSFTSNAPTSFFRQHHPVEQPEINNRAFRPYFRVRTRLEKLAREGAISGFEYRVSLWLRSCYERGYSSDLQSAMPRLGMAVHSSWRSREDPASRRAQAREYLVHVEKALDDLSWARPGQRLNCHAKTAKVWAVQAIKALATV
jgi:hypothetical protein